MPEINTYIEQLVDNIVDAQHSSAKENFDDIMANKIEDILSSKKSDLAQNMFNKPEDE